MIVDSFKEVMSNYPTGVTVVTTTDVKGSPIGLTVNSFASVSVDPLLILWSIDKRVFSYNEFQKTEHFVVNILAKNQEDIALLFASSITAQERFERCDWSYSERKLPIIEGATASLQCKTFQRVDAGDHLILIGEILEINSKNESPLLYHKRKMGAFPEQFHMR